MGFSATIASVVIRSPDDGRCILKRGAHDLGRIDDARLEEVAVDAGLRIVAEGVVGILQDLADDDGAVVPGVLDDLARRRGERLADDLGPDTLLLVCEL